MAIPKPNGISPALSPCFRRQRIEFNIIIEFENGLRATFERIVIYFRRHNEPPRAEVDDKKCICVAI